MLQTAWNPPSFEWVLVNSNKCQNDSQTSIHLLSTTLLPCQSQIPCRRKSGQPAAMELAVNWQCQQWIRKYWSYNEKKALYTITFRWTAWWAFTHWSQRACWLQLAKISSARKIQYRPYALKLCKWRLWQNVTTFQASNPLQLAISSWTSQPVMSW